jgi:hypothetical protein
LDQRKGGAGEQLRRARDILRKLAAEFPAVAQYQQELALVEYNLGLLALSAARQEKSVALRADRQAEAVASYKASARLLESLKRRFPRTPAFRQNLARAQVAMSESLGRTVPAGAETALRKALEEQSALLAEFPGVSEYQRTLGRGHYQLARLLLVPDQITYKPEDAVHQAEEAQVLFKQVLQAHPDSDADQLNLAEDQGVLTLALIAAGRLSDAMATAEQLPVTRPADPEAYRRAAALLVRCAAAASKTDDGQQFAERSLARAVGILRDAVRARLIRSSAALDHPDLHPLRDRDDFKALRGSLPQPDHRG